MMKVGDKASVHTRTFGDGAREGRVIWIHPKGRFALLEFEIRPQAPKWMKQPATVYLRECFLLAR